MNPAQAMGTFLRIWRSEWAGLSRAQLATAVSWLCPKGKGVTTDIVREWESGQPPKSSSELNALLKVMRRHGLSQLEIGRVRNVVFAACAGRQYPEVLGSESLAHREDVDELAERLYRAQMAVKLSPNIVTLVVSTKELQQAVLEDLSPKVSRGQARRQQAALAYLKGGLADYLGWKDGMGLRAAALWAANAEFVSARFGRGGLGGRLSVLGQRRNEAWVHAHGGRSRVWARRLLELSERAWATGERDEAVRLFFDALHCLSESEEDAYAALRPRAEQYLGMEGSLPPRQGEFATLGPLFWPSLADGLTDEAERQLGEPADRADVPPTEPIEWRRAAGYLALARGGYAEAQSHFEAALEIARRYGLCEQAVLRELQFCDQARRRGRPMPYRELIRARGPDGAKPRGGS